MFSEMEVSRATKILLSRFVKRWMAWGTERWVFGEVLGCSVAPKQLCPRAADLKTPRPDTQHQETSLSGGPPSSVEHVIARAGVRCSRRVSQTSFPGGATLSGCGGVRLRQSAVGSNHSDPGDSGTKADEEDGPQGDCPEPAVCPEVHTLKARIGDGSEHRRFRRGPRPVTLQAQGCHL